MQYASDISLKVEFRATGELPQPLQDRDPIRRGRVACWRGAS